MKKEKAGQIIHACIACLKYTFMYGPTIEGTNMVTIMWNVSDKIVIAMVTIMLNVSDKIVIAKFIDNIMLTIV